MGKENREVKNSVLIDLFCNDETAEENDISLYNALHETPLPEGTRIEKIRIENVIYMNFYNDISFGVDGKVLVMAEHQSTVNYNMPLRSLLYVGRVYEQIVQTDARYKKKLVRLPRPEFYTFYNGTEMFAKEQVMHLSDAFAFDDGTEPMLDLKVRVININPVAGHEILQRCPVLREYAFFIDTIRKYQKKGCKDAYKYAIQECIQKGILKDYLMKKGSEVENMLIAEYDYDTDIRVQREEAYEDGWDAGRVEGFDQGRSEGLNQGRSEGLNQGRSEGLNLGRRLAQEELIRKDEMIRKLERELNEMKNASRIGK